MSRGSKRGRDNIYEAIKAQYCDPTDEDRSNLKTPQTACAHCNAGQTRNTSEMHWHLCVCPTFGSKDPDLQNMLRTCVPDSLLRSHKKKKLFETWHGGMHTLEPESEKSKPLSENTPKKKKIIAGPRNLGDEPINVTLNKLIARWVYMYQIPVAAVEAPEFRDIIKLLNNDIHRLPDKETLSRSLIDSVYQQTCAQVAETLTKAESLQIQLPLDFTYHNGSSSSSSSFGDGTSQSYLHVYDGRGTFFYQLPMDVRSNSYSNSVIGTIEAARSILEMPNTTVVSLRQSAESYTDATLNRAHDVIRSCESLHPHKIYIPSQPFSPKACAEMMLRTVPAFDQAVSHARCLVRYFLHATTPAAIVRSIVSRLNSSNLAPEFKLPKDDSAQSVSEMLTAVSNAQQANVFNRLLLDGTYNNYFHSLSREESSASQEARLVQTILVSEAAMTGIVQAAYTVQLLLGAASRAARPHGATYSDGLAIRDALLGTVSNTNMLTHPWRVIVSQLIAGEWDKSHHPLVALACKLDPRRKFADLPSAMEADAQRVRDKLIAHVEPSVRKAVLDSWVLMLKREDAFGSAFSLENAHSQTPKDWWIAHTAAHKELRELVAFPALSALGVTLDGNGGDAKNDPSAAGLGCEADLENVVRTVGLNDALLESNDLVCKLSYIRHNAWCLHHARLRAQDVNMKHQMRLLSQEDLSIYDCSGQLMAAASMHSTSTASHASHSSHVSHSLYAHNMDNYDFSALSEHSVNNSANNNSNNSHAPSTGQQYITLHPSGSPSQQLSQQHQQQRGESY